MLQVIEKRRERIAVEEAARTLCAAVQAGNLARGDLSPDPLTGSAPRWGL